MEEEEHQQGGLTSGLDDALDESDEYLEDFSSSTQMHEAVVSPPAYFKKTSGHSGDKESIGFGESYNAAHPFV